MFLYSYFTMNVKITSLKTLHNDSNVSWLIKKFVKSFAVPVYTALFK